MQTEHLSIRHAIIAHADGQRGFRLLRRRWLMCETKVPAPTKACAVTLRPVAIFDQAPGKSRERVDYCSESTKCGGALEAFAIENWKRGPGRTSAGRFLHEELPAPHERRITTADRSLSYAPRPNSIPYTPANNAVMVLPRRRVEQSQARSTSAMLHAGLGPRCQKHAGGRWQV